MGGLADGVRDCTCEFRFGAADDTRSSPRDSDTTPPQLSSRATCRRIRYRMFSQPGGLWANPTTGNRYRGINVLALISTDFSDPRWMTYKQAQAQGWQVRGGERSTQIQHWIWEEERVRVGKDGQLVLGSFPLSGRIGPIFSLNLTSGYQESNNFENITRLCQHRLLRPICGIL
jgi:hypothetical protein